MLNYHILIDKELERNYEEKKHVANTFVQQWSMRLGCPLTGVVFVGLQLMMHRMPHKKTYLKSNRKENENDRKPVSKSSV